MRELAESRRNPTKGGKAFWAGITTTAIRDDRGELRGFAKTEDGDFVLSSVVDITERKRAEQATERLTAQLRTLNAELEERVRSRTSELTGALKERETLLQEIQHRVKNNQQAIPCGLVLNELIMNALKHGFTDGRPGTIRVEFSRLEGGRFRLTVKDNGVGLLEGFAIATSESLGLQLVSTLSHQLDAELEVRGREGTLVQLTFAAEG